MSAKSARIETATRSPSIRLCSFVCTIASAVRGGTCASESAVFRSASEMNGTPPARFVCALAATRSGTAGLFWTPVRNEAVSAEMRTAPASAVPIDAPSCVPGVLDSADLAALLVGHRRHGHAPQLGGDRADPGTR